MKQTAEITKWNIQISLLYLILFSIIAAWGMGCGVSNMLHVVPVYDGEDIQRDSVVLLNYKDVRIIMVDGTPLTGLHVGNTNDVLMLKPGSHELLIEPSIIESTGSVVRKSWTTPKPVIFFGQAGGTYMTQTKWSSQGSIQFEFIDITDHIVVLY